MQKRWFHLLLFLLALSPGLWMAGYVAKHAVDVGCWDMWENGPLLKKWHEGTLTWGDLYAPQIQHRIIVPRLLIIGLTHLGGGDFRLEQWATFSFSLASAGLLWVLLTRSVGRSNWRYGLLFVANLLIFSPMLYQNFFWGSAMWMTIPLPCLLASLVVLGSRWPLWLKFALAVLLAEVATHSFSHGLVVWPLVLGYLLLQPEIGPLRRRLAVAGIWTGIATITVGCYLHDFTNVAHHAYNLRPGDHALKGGVKLFVGTDPESLSATIGNLARVGRFFLGMLGALFARNPFSGHLVEDAQALGIWVVSPLACVTALLLFTKIGRSLWRDTLPFLAIAAYVIGVALVISMGRAHLGEHRCVLPRYFTVTLFAPVTTITLGFLWTRRFVNGIALGDTVRELAKRSGLVILTVFATLQVPLWRHGLHLCRVWNDARRQGRALVMFINHEQLKPWSISVLDMDLGHWGYQQTREQVNTLKSLGLLRIPVLETPELRWFHKDPRQLGPDKAVIETVKADGDRIIVTGNARFGTARPADLLLITAANSDHILALGVPTPKPILRLYPLDYEFSNNHEVPVGEPYRWEARFPSSAIPGGIARLEVWALDIREMRITRVKQSVAVPPSTLAP